MTREERENALHCLKVMIDEEVCEECNLYGTTGTDHCEADCVRTAIKALEQEPIIDVNVPHKIAEFFSNWDGDENAKIEISVNDMREISNMFVTKCRAESKLKALQQEPKTGHWIPSHIPESILDECSECGFSCGAFTFNYCPNCGCRMVKPQESEK